MMTADADPLAVSALLPALCAEQRAHLTAHGETIERRVGEVPSAEGAPGETLSLVRRGRVARRR